MENFLGCIKNNGKRIINLLGINIVHLFSLFYVISTIIFEKNFVEFISLLIVSVILSFVIYKNINFNYLNKINSIIGVLVPLILLFLIICFDINNIFNKYNLLYITLTEILNILFFFVFFIISSFLLNISKVKYDFRISFFSLFGNVLKCFLFIIMLLSVFKNKEISVTYNLAKLVSIFNIIEFIIYILLKDKYFTLDKWFSYEYLGFYENIKNFSKNFNPNLTISRNHTMSKCIEKKILNKFKTKNGLYREKFLITKRHKYLIATNGTFLKICKELFTSSVVITLLYTLANKYLDKSSLIFLEILNRIIEKNDIVTYIFIYFYIISLAILLSFLIFEKNKLSRNKKRYLEILNYIIENYENLYIENSIKQLCIGDVSYPKNYYLNTVIIEYKKLIDIENLKDLLEFFVDNGIQVLFYSYNFMKKKIEKDLNTARLYNHEYFIIGKKEIEKIKIENYIKDKEEDTELYQILSEKLGISTNEKFIISEIEEKIKLEFVDFEDKFFSNFKEVLEFLQSKME